LHTKHFNIKTLVMTMQSLATSQRHAVLDLYPSKTQFSMIYPGSSPVGNATLVVVNVLTCNKHSQNPDFKYAYGVLLVLRCRLSSLWPACCLRPS
jgi:hypothetical protein